LNGGRWWKALAWISPRGAIRDLVIIDPRQHVGMPGLRIDAVPLAPAKTWSQMRSLSGPNNRAKPPTRSHLIGSTLSVQRCFLWCALRIAYKWFHSNDQEMLYRLE